MVICYLKKTKRPLFVHLGNHHTVERQNKTETYAMRFKNADFVGIDLHPHEFPSTIPNMTQYEANFVSGLKKIPPRYFGARIKVLEEIGIGSDKLHERLKNFNKCRNSLSHETDIFGVEFYGINIQRKKPFKNKIEKEYRSLFRQLNKLAKGVCEGVYVKPYVKNLQN